MCKICSTPARQLGALPHLPGLVQNLGSSPIPATRAKRGITAFLTVICFIFDNIVPYFVAEVKEKIPEIFKEKRKFGFYKG